MLQQQQKVYLGNWFNKRKQLEKKLEEQNEGNCADKMKTYSNQTK